MTYEKMDRGAMVTASCLQTRRLGAVVSMLDYVDRNTLEAERTYVKT
jgi:hypothetical protein